MIGLVIFAILWYRKRSNARQSPEELEKAQIDITSVEPFTYQTTPLELPRIDTIMGVEPPVTRLNSTPPRLPAKVREHLGYTQQQNMGPASNGSTSAYTSSTTPPSSRNPPTDELSEPRSTTSPLSPEEVEGLRTEVENLRRVMQAFQTERYEPPPGYDTAASGPSTSTRQENGDV